VIAPEWYALGFADLELKIEKIRRRLARGRDRLEDRDELAELETSLAELRALYRADLRIELELLVDGIRDPLDVALIQAEELLVDDLTLRIIPFETREALRREREADWSVILYRLADSGRETPATI